MLVSGGYLRVGVVAGRAMRWPRGDTGDMGLLGWSDGGKLCEDMVFWLSLILWFFSQT